MKSNIRLKYFIFLIIAFIVGCSSNFVYKRSLWDPGLSVKQAMKWMLITKKIGAKWGIDPRLIIAIIAVESGGNPNLISKSNAVGLMQIKAVTAGREVYRYMGWHGQPSTNELKKPARNILIGTAYLSILKHGILKGIKDPEIMQYALLISYTNGASSLLRTFSLNHQEAISKINTLSKRKLFRHIIKNYSISQTLCYIQKIQLAMNLIQTNTNSNINYLKYTPKILY